MSSFPASFGGAVDLSSLVNKAKAQSTGQPNGTDAGTAQHPTGSTGATEVPIEVQSLVLDVSPAQLANFVKISERVPVLVEFHTARSQGGAELSRKLAQDVARREGDMILLRIDGDHAQVGELLRAFQVQSLPAVCALLLGQPVPLFNGDQTPEVVKQVLDKMILLARENGVNQRAELAEGAEQPSEPPLPPRHAAAYEAMESGDYAKAVEEFEAALREAPADAIADGGLAQAKLLLRTDGLDLEKVLSAPALTIQDVLSKADVLTVIGHFDKAFDAILDTFAAAPKEDRDLLRPHLLELFKVAGPQAPEVGQARARLTNLLY
jgi:putative thioredoxin